MVGYNILPIGFSTYEKSTIETFFRLAGRRAPHWSLTTLPSEARVVLFNATSEQDVASFRSQVASWQKVIIVGPSDYGTGWPVLPRPIKLTVILTLLDALSQVQTEAVILPAPAAQTAATQPAATFKPVEIAAPMVSITEPAPAVRASKVTVLAASTPAAAFVKPSMTDVFASITTPIEVKAELEKPASVSLNEAPSFNFYSNNTEQINTANVVTRNATSPSAEIGRVLLVDDSDIALKYMQNRLRHFGYECDMVRSGEEALARVASHNYHFVFLDVMMAGLDGYQTCKAIKNNKARRGPAPVVVMLTSKGGTIDKIRGSMAGCDAYLTKPLNDKKLGTVLAKFDESTVAQRWEASHPHQALVDTYSPRKL
jgi:two-component system, cell cycle response regulator